MRDWNVIIIGAGPAGAMAACELAAVGNVLLIDKSTFPRSKVCGCCLNGAALDQLEQVGLRDTVMGLGITLDRLRLYIESKRIELKLPTGLSLSREVFDHTLVLNAVQRGVNFLPECTAIVQSFGEQSCRVQIKDSRGKTEVLECAVAVIADGLGGTALQNFRDFDVTSYPRSRIGVGCRLTTAPSFYEPGSIYMSYGSGGYAGVVALEDGSFDMAAALDPGVLRNDRPSTSDEKHSHAVAEAIARIMAEAGVATIEDLTTSHWRGTKPLTCKRRQLSAQRVFVVGDSASYVEPFTGEGIAWALASARALAPIARRASQRWDDLLAAQWQYVHRRIIRKRQETSKAVAAALKQPRLASSVAGLLHKAPFTVSPFIRAVNSPIVVK